MNTFPTPRHRGYARPSSETSARVRSFLARWGEHVAGVVFGVDGHTVIRCGSGVTMQGLALRAIEQGLSMPEDRLEAAARAFEEARTRRAAP
ncbi:MAG TPA: hypothetical protein VE987_15915 [Polyangiaceae bacterium]|nr:hypothetical protein [Polyangiaceae bacterium]